MKPQEKALELVNKYDNTLTYLESRAKVKDCVLIAVDEIISELEDVKNFTGNKFSSEMIKYWNKVKQEIEKL